MKRSLLALAIPVVALAVAALGTSSTAATYSPVASASPTAKVELSHTKLGKVLADGSGRTLYLFEKDKGRKSTCSGACATAWPPLTTTGKPRRGPGVSASKLKYHKPQWRRQAGRVQRAPALPIREGHRPPSRPRAKTSTRSAPTGMSSPRRQEDRQGWLVDQSANDWEWAGWIRTTDRRVMSVFRRSGAVGSTRWFRFPEPNRCPLRADCLGRFGCGRFALCLHPVAHR